MASLPCEYVVTGGKLKCNRCVKPDTEVEIRGTHDSGIFPQGKKACTVEDKIPFINIPSFGKCKVTGRECVPFLLKWIIPNPVSSNNMQALLVKRAIAPCVFGGVVIVKKSGQLTRFEMFMELVKKIEEAYPDWSKEEVLNALTTLAGYGNREFRAILGIDGGPPLVPNANLTQENIDDLQKLLVHGYDNNDNETGVMTDANGTNFVMGHTLLGILTGANRDRNGGWGVHAAEGATGAGGVVLDTGGVVADTIGVGSDVVGLGMDGVGYLADGAGHLADGTEAACDGFNRIPVVPDIPGCDAVGSIGDGSHAAANSLHGAANTAHDFADGMYETADTLHTGADAMYGMTDNVDNLTSATIAGDLGQSAAYVQEGQHIGTGQHTYIGPGTEATYAELAGDIDGMVIGEMIGSNSGDNVLKDMWNDPDASLSSFLDTYYTDYDGTRFQNAQDFLPAVNGEDYLENEVIKFANNYEHKTSFLRLGWGNTDDDAQAAFAEYEEWVNQQAADEQNGSKPSIAQQLEGKITDGTCEP